MNRALILLPVGVALLFAGTATMLTGWFILGAGASASVKCETTAALDDRAVPAKLAPLYAAAAAKYDLGTQGPSILAAINKVETDFGRNLNTSSAGAVGWMQFMPDTWASYGVDGNGDGRRDPNNPPDAIHAAAHYLHSLGAPENWHDAIFGYNHAEWYVDKVLDNARTFAEGGASGAASALTSCELSQPAPTLGRGHRVYGGGKIVPIPGDPGETIDERILADLLALRARYHFKVTDGYAPTGHAAGGEHPLGLAVDLVPGRGGTWDDIDALARWAEPKQGRPRSPFRWVGYDGDSGHGRGDHLHLSWSHSPAAPGARPVQWVEVLAGAR
jgi:hypothetical protein